MKGIILAGGTGSRLKPLTNVTNKHLLPVGKYPMIFYPIYRMKQAGIKEILIVTGREHMGDVMELLGSGREFGLEFTFKVQDEGGIIDRRSTSREKTIVLTACGPAGAMLVRKQAIKEVGLLYETFSIYCFDKDWCFRMRKA